MHVHGRKISNCASPLSHMQGLRLPTLIDSVRLRLCPFDYNFMHPSNYIHYRKRQLCRQRDSLPMAKESAVGKDPPLPMAKTSRR
jgi:hypothetical protein